VATNLSLTDFVVAKLALPNPKIRSRTPTLRRDAFFRASSETTFPPQSELPVCRQAGAATITNP